MAKLIATKGNIREKMEELYRKAHQEQEEKERREPKQLRDWNE